MVFSEYGHSSSLYMLAITIIILGIMKLTAQRQLILKLINTSNRHWDAAEVARELVNSGHSIGIATVYRGLAALEKRGLISPIQLADKKCYERADKAHHDHIICTNCGLIEEFSHNTIEALQQAAADEKGFQLTGHQLVMFGFCAQCSNKVTS